MRPRRAPARGKEVIRGRARPSRGPEDGKTRFLHTPLRGVGGFAWKADTGGGGTRFLRPLCGACGSASALVPVHSRGNTRAWERGRPARSRVSASKLPALPGNMRACTCAAQRAVCSRYVGFALNDSLWYTRARKNTSARYRYRRAHGDLCVSPFCVMLFVKNGTKPGRASSDARVPRLHQGTHAPRRYGCRALRACPRCCLEREVEPCLDECASL